MKKLRMYALTAANVPSRTSASVQAATRTINSARQAMVSFRDASASQTCKLIRGIEPQALEEVHEFGSGGCQCGFLAEHLHEPDALVGPQQRCDQPASLRAFAGEVVDGYGPGLALDRAARGGEPALVRRRQPDLVAPPIDDGQLAADRTGEHHHRDVDRTVDLRLERAHAP